MPRPLRTRPVSAAQIRAYAGKAQESVNVPPEKTTAKFWSSSVRPAATALKSGASFAVCCR